MDISNIPLFSMLNRSVDWLALNHQVLAENVANADTPRYRSRELEPLDFERLLRVSAQQVRIRVTNRAHLQGLGGAAGDQFKARTNDDVYDVSLTGNAVSLEQQAVLIAKNAMDYQLATTLYGKSLGMIRTAVGQRR
ncbi:MAG: flagellar basal-body rod protein FlgB [Alphaproteobacteria bacterium]|jgi:flagellar basal-body rod protein FlgB|nr:flagellar basal-body rod protein FlgB [Alphaproteobacteria bacterium]MDP6518193.1 flagellar basal-body rod protein FlgB [Alphaproteobacteria bacterium]|tara:strand:+ start:128 stop:538 length:411 start_codon:yes stop_codon:yes gene_type:complete